jgi:hypothetical protein
VIDDGDNPAFVDRHWVPECADIAMPALRFDSTRSLWWEARKQPATNAAPSFVGATRELAWFASNIADTVSDLAPECPCVTGRGVTAELVRRRMPGRPGGPGSQPAVI